MKQYQTFSESSLMRGTALALLLCFPFLAGFPCAASAQFDELVRRVPRSTNVLVLVNTEKILESPAALKGDWKTKVAEAHKSGVTLLPPETKQAVFAAELDLDFGAPLWQAMLARRPNVPDVQAIAKRRQGTVDNIGGVAGVQLPQDAYVLRFASDLVGYMTPANRQSVGRWLRDMDTRSTPDLSKYLTEAYGFANDVGTPLIMALDLSDVATEEGVKAKLTDRWKEAGFEGKADLPAVAKVLAGIRGATLGVTFRNEPFGSLKVDFEDDVTPLAPIAQDLLMQVLHERGAFINEFEDWELAIKGKQIRLSGKLTDSGLRRLFSVFDPPPSINESSQNENGQNQPTAANDKDVILKKSLSYFHAVQDYMKDLKREPARQGNHYSAGSIATWYDNYARKIDNLPVLNVDPYLVEFGAQVSDGLRKASYAIKTGGVQAKTAQLNAPKQYNVYSGGETYGYSYRSDWYGAGYVPYGTSWTAAVRDVREEQGQAARIRTEYRNKSIFSAREIIDGIDAAMADVRRQLTQKYNVEF